MSKKKGFIFIFYLTIILGAPIGFWLFKQTILDQYLLLYEKYHHYLNSENSSGLLKGSTHDSDQELILRLKEELVIQKYLVEQFKWLRQENIRLKKTLDYISHSELKITLAQVILIDPQNHFISFRVNQGSKHGVQKGLPVIGYQNGERNLIGFVFEVNPSSSLIKTIIDQQTHVGIEIGMTGSKAIIKGQSKFNPLLKIDYLDKSLTNLIDQPVYTSGIGGKYPQGILVGKIKKILRKNYGLFQNAWVKPSIDFFTIQEVMILQTTNF